MNPENNLNPTPQPAQPPVAPNLAQPAEPMASTTPLATPGAPLAQPTPPPQPVQPAQSFQPVSPAANPAASANPGTPTQSVLNVPVMTPTHFDNQTTYTSRPMSPSTPAPMSADEKIKKFTILSIALGASTLVFLIIAVVCLISAASNGSKLSQTQKSLDNKSAIVAAVEQTTGVSPIDNPEQVPVWNATKNYVYVTEWDVKLKIPEDLTSVSYILDQKFRPSICFNAVQKGLQSFPAFADIAKNPGGMGCLTKVAVSEGNNDVTTGVSFGEKVFTYKDFSYFYTAPTKTYSTEASEQGLERTAVQLIYVMLKDNISQYE
ncbi:hypothetical protein IKF76_00565 [Candidatus Saccharibacteria bacterium]|nr:hypothetical protein [Candidatus Saccharibacteria bacterium]